MQKTQQDKKLLEILKAININDVITVTQKHYTIIKKIIQAISCRVALPITEYTVYPEDITGMIIFEICPACKCEIDRRYQAYCDRCGQRLKWTSCKKMKDASKKYITLRNKKT